MTTIEEAKKASAELEVTLAQLVSCDHQEAIEKASPWCGQCGARQTPNPSLPAHPTWNLAIHVLKIQALYKTLIRFTSERKEEGT